VAYDVHGNSDYRKMQMYRMVSTTNVEHIMAMGGSEQSIGTGTPRARTYIIFSSAFHDIQSSEYPSIPKLSENNEEEEGQLLRNDRVDLKLQGIRVERSHGHGVALE
jgi:hypothetical protein